MKDAALVARLRAALLDWYDRHGRKLPWRNSGQGHATADPYRIWLSEVMLQQTTVGHAAPYYDKFLRLWPTVGDLAAAEDGRVMAEWAGLGYYARARRLLECARTVVREHGGRFPHTEAGLLALPGFGPYTAAAVAALAYHLPANVIDGNIERIMSRLYAITTPLPAAKPEIREAGAQWLSEARPADWPQALMDLAALVCRPKSPLCLTDPLACPVAEACAARAQGQPERFPIKAAKPVRPRRFGTVFVMRAGDAVIVERRPDKGLLGGMLGLPHSDWGADETPPAPPLEGVWRDLGDYEHVFTHFALSQSVKLLDVPPAEAASLLRQHNGWQWLPLDQASSLPTVFAKALRKLDQDGMTLPGIAFPSPLPS
ncbi:A/G-specific adenine glycosylase [Asticcacaulis sp. EMRT-3]|uniref:A/G-specific adenine glycosylase n=1 Tax=Asticcacaulis sp. EMRT-3 TaxID=3040349 RepID=UPI0024AECB9E|nr:A/G-specific adenine glycosylase [Asticcacaulis sp. EMRT-3]MDI7774057.1 A/G-specific adenine glycosylase [Asticcacaulis sp. EMRT-3]